MAQQYSDVQGIDFTLPAAPPITDPPLSLLSEVRKLINLDGQVARRQALVEKLASAQEQLENDDRDIFDNEGDSEQDATLDLKQQMSEWEGQIASLDTAMKDLQRFERGFVYLPELSNAAGMSTVTEDASPAITNAAQGALKAVGPNQEGFLWYDPFIVVGLDSRSSFGWPGTDMADRVGRAVRALRGHESWQVEREWWSGVQVPTNWHLTASPDSPLTSPHRTITPFANPTAAPTTTLGVAVSLSDSLAALDQAIANADAGTGMIHATPYVVQKWAQVYSYLRDSTGNIRTVNNNLIVPGYGYPGTGPDAADRTVTDGVLNTTTTLVSATLAFTDADVGRPISDEDGEIPPGTVIVSVTNGTTVIMSKAATASESGAHITVSGQGGDSTGSTKQWAYATDAIYHCQGDVMTYPLDLREQSPGLTVNNLVEARAERTHALPSNQFVRAAVLVDTTTP